ncbi:hypothetical protein [Naasia lichenicola]|uniref:Uncharacterized protein n=1 Tax=Naasia lichenicola TaxID=2565933 RepID=A0A4S4FEW7_9MICO|nr:hypothetical protein [Naasia lichenicola]THG28661.1 hypothetical protein E6C64_17880 [Naasia lichenicola]
MTDDGRQRFDDVELSRVRMLAGSPDLAMRLSLAEIRHPLPDDVWQKLMRDRDPRVPTAMAGQPGATTRQLEQLVAIRPALGPVVGQHEHAPLRYLRLRIVSSTDSRIRERFLAKVGADAADRRVFLRETARLAHLKDHKTTLGEIWDRVDGSPQPQRERSTDRL